MLLLGARPCGIRSQNSQIGSAGIYFILSLQLDSHPGIPTLDSRHFQTVIPNPRLLFFGGNSWEQSQTCSFFPLFPHPGSWDSTIPMIFLGNCSAHSHRSRNGLKPFQGKQGIHPLPILCSRWISIPRIRLGAALLPEEPSGKGTFPKKALPGASRPVFHGSQTPPLPFPTLFPAIPIPLEQQIPSRMRWDPPCAKIHGQGIALGAFPCLGMEFQPILLRLPWIHEEGKG